MKYIVRKYYSGYCNYEIDADNEDNANKLANEMPIDYNQVVETLEEWEDCNEVEVTANI